MLAMRLTFTVAAWLASEVGFLQAVRAARAWGVAGNREDREAGTHQLGLNLHEPTFRLATAEDWSTGESTYAHDSGGA